MSYRDLYVSADDWYLEVQYVDGDRWYVTSPNPEELADIRDQQRHAHGDRIRSAVIARTRYDDDDGAADLESAFGVGLPDIKGVYYGAIGLGVAAKAYAEANVLPIVEITTTELGGTIMEIE